MSKAQLAALAEETIDLRLPRLDDDLALRLGEDLLATARAQHLKVGIGVDLGGKHVFRATLPGTNADYQTWIERKLAAVRRFGRSTLELELTLDEDPGFASIRALDPAEIVLVGGALPLMVGPLMVGAVAAAGLPSAEDHAFVADGIRRLLKQLA